MGSKFRQKRIFNPVQYFQPKYCKCKEQERIFKNVEGFKNIIYHVLIVSKQGGKARKKKNRPEVEETSPKVGYKENSSEVGGGDRRNSPAEERRRETKFS